MNRDEFWREQDDVAVLAEYLSEHTYESSFDIETDTLAIHVGDDGRLPTMPEEGLCGLCRTAVRKRDGVGWVHEVSFKERGGCPEVMPPVGVLA